MSSEGEQLRQVRLLLPLICDFPQLDLIQEVRVLEENLDNSLKEEMSALEKLSTPNSDYEDGRQVRSKERSTQLEVS